MWAQLLKPRGEKAPMLSLLFAKFTGALAIPDLQQPPPGAVFVLGSWQEVEECVRCIRWSRSGKEGNSIYSGDTVRPCGGKLLIPLQ